MTLEEKIGQLFFIIEPDEKTVPLSDFIKKYQPGGMMSRAGSAEQVRRQFTTAQECSKFPMFLAANLESGGTGIVTEGTWLGNPLQVAATGKNEYAYELGNVGGYEGRQVGVNMAFAPIVDIDYNFKNPITNTRTFGDDPKRVLEMSQAQIKGFSNQDVISVAKHFPGDGVDDRDQHLLASINSMSAKEWSETFGYVYKNLIEDGIPSLMIGHIYLPSWEKKLNPY